MRRSDILDDTKDGAAFIAHVTAEGDSAAAHSAALVHDDVAEDCRRGAVHISVDIEITTDRHYRSRRGRPGRDRQITSLDLCVVLETGDFDALGLRILRGSRHNDEAETEQNRFH